MKQITLFDLQAFTKTEDNPVYDPSWDEVETAPQQINDEPWNLADFGEAPRKVDEDGQISIFWDDSDEPPDPDDYPCIEAYLEAWSKWELRVGGQNLDPESPYKSVGGQVVSNTLDTCTVHTGEVICNTKKSAPQHDIHWVEKYWVERSGNKYWYYRYCWMTGRKIHRCYLGSVHSKLAKHKKADVEVWISDGQSPSEIQNLIASWRDPKRSQS
ncbi:MAG: hypothetical protein PUP90_02365 [Nostoc sp. S4]|nr:hypothetical protein [Nostoc sp. S4]